MSGDAGRRAVRCAIHVHTDFSDGAEAAGAVVAAAAGAGVEALFLTDHDGAHAVRAGWSGLHDGVLVVAGAELKTRDRDHLLVFGTHEKIATRLLDTPAALALLDKLGAVVFVAHPQGRPQKLFFRRRYRWRHWDRPDFDGLEVWSYMHDWIEGCTPWGLPAMCRDPGVRITGPDPDVLAAWDRLAGERPAPGFGGLDTHGAQLPFGLGRFFSWAREGILPYAQNFAAFATYALVPRGPLEGRRGEADVIAALRAGRSWFCHDALHPGRDCRFEADVADRTVPVGAETVYAPGARLRLRLPREAAVRIVRGGEAVCETTAASLSFDAPAPGAYRAEAYLDGRAWLFTNHICLRDPGGTV